MSKLTSSNNNFWRRAAREQDASKLLEMLNRQFKNKAGLLDFLASDAYESGGGVNRIDNRKKLHDVLMARALDMLEKREVSSGIEYFRVNEQTVRESGDRVNLDFGDMYQETYDPDGDGVVEEADNAGTVNNLTVETAVPPNALFTDTIFDDSTILALIGDLETDIDDIFLTAIFGGDNISELVNDVGYLTDAPSDGNPYVRQDGAWVQQVDTGDKTYVHNQNSALSVWTIPHNLDKSPTVKFQDASGNQMYPQRVEYVSNNSINAYWAYAVTGTAILN